LGQKQTLAHVRVMSALPPKADVGTGACIHLTQQLRQLGDIRRDPPRLIFGERLGRRSPTGLILEIDIGKLLPRPSFSFALKAGSRHNQLETQPGYWGMPWP